MKNFVKLGDTITLIAPGDVASGDFLLVGGVAGVAAYSAASGEEVEVKTTGIFALPKANVAIAQGDELYWDSVAEALTNAPAPGLPMVAVASKGALLAATTVEAKLTPVPAAPALFGLKAKIIAGGAAGDHTVTGIAEGDHLVLVKRYDVDAGSLKDVSDITAEFSVTAADTINNAGGTNTTGDKLEIWYAEF